MKTFESCQFHDGIIDEFNCFCRATNYKTLAENFKIKSLPCQINFKQWCD